MPPKRKRRPTTPGEYSDPLSNYDAPEYGDELERALTQDAVGDMEITPIAAVPSTMSIAFTSR